MITVVIIRKLDKTLITKSNMKKQIFCIKKHVTFISVVTCNNKVLHITENVCWESDVKLLEVIIK